MKVIIAGSRTITDWQTLIIAIDGSQFEIDEVVSGGASGIDRLGELWAKENGVEVKRFTAFWDVHGRAAGPIRNQEMADYVGPEGGLIAIWDGQSKGTKGMIAIARKTGMKVYVHKVRL